MRYVALIRKLNAGSENRITKEKLAELFALCACRNINVYINSGNVIFDSDESSQTLAENIGAALSAYFKNQMQLLVLSQAEFQAVAEKIPLDWLNDESQRTDVGFYFDGIGDKVSQGSLPFNYDYVRIKILPNAMAWNLQKSNLNASKLNKLISSEIYDYLTIRNINTVRKISELLGE